MPRFLGDLRYGWRVLRRAPVNTLVMLGTLAVGIGAATTVFSLADAVLWRALPYRAEAALVSIEEQRPRESRLDGPVSPADFDDWREQARSFTAIAALEDPGIREIAFNRSGESPESLRAIVVTPDFLRVLGIGVAPGRDLTDVDARPGGEPVVLLTDAVWRRRFAADPRIVGQTIELEGGAVTVIGVVQASFWWPSRPDILMPATRTGDEPTLRTSHYFRVIARRRPEVDAAAADAEMAAIGRHLAQLHPDENDGHFPRVRPLRTAMVGDVRVGMIVLLASVGLLLLITGANVAALLLARAVDRRREFAVRAAMGASRPLLVRQMLAESLLLAGAGGGGGLALAAAALAVLRRVLPVQFTALPGIDSVGIDARVASVALGVAVALVLAGGGLSALVWWRRTGTDALRERQGSGGRASQRARAALVAAELAFSVVLLTGAALVIVSFVQLTRVSPGFEAQQVVVSTLAVPGSRYETQQQTAAFFTAVLDRLAGAPGVDATAAVTSLPFAGLDPRTSFRREHDDERRAEDVPMRAHPRLVTPGYFALMRQPLLRGRDITRDDAEGAPDVVILNETAARLFWPDRDPIGQRMAFNLGPDARWLEIVGVAGDVRHAGLDTDPRAEAYLPYTQPTFGWLGARMSIAVRSGLELAAVSALMREAVADADARQPIGIVQSMDALIGESMQTRRLTLTLLAGFAAVALVISAAGLYGLISHAVTQRTREIGVRLALGATPGRVIGLVMRQSAVIITSGLVCGMLGALAGRRYIAGLLFGVSASDPLVLGAVGGVLVVVGLAAALVPSLRAARTSPAVALQE